VNITNKTTKQNDCFVSCR